VKGCSGRVRICDSVDPKRSTPPRGGVEAIEGVLVRTHGVALTGAKCKRAWPAGLRRRALSGARRRTAPRRRTRSQTRGRQRTSELAAVRCRLPQLKGAGGRRQERELEVAPARTQVKLSRTNAALSQARIRDAKPLSCLRSRRSAIVPQCVASAPWGAHRANRPMRVS